MIGGLLGKSSRVKELWIKTAKDMSSIFDSGEGNKVLNILNLSYKHLPVYLKVCFLYLGLFPEDDYIHVSQLIKLWIAEGLIKPKLDQSLEEVAESYIKELVDRNLLLVSRWSEVNKKFRGFRVHDLVRDLCVKIAEKENLFSVERSMDGSRRYIVEERMARYYLGDREYHPWKTPSIIHPLILFGNAPGPFKSRLLRVVRDIGDLSSTCQEVSLRFLYHEPHFAGLDRTPTYKLPSSVSLLWRLQTLIVSQCKLVVPSEIWKMPQLRHIDITPVFLLTPPLSDDVFVLRNLQTLETVQNLIFSEEVCKRMPNIKELSIDYQDDESGKGSPCYNLQSVGCFDKLESLGYSCYMYEYSGLQNLKLPSSLKELRLEGCNLAWREMAMIASLPHLQILEFRFNAVEGPEWNFVEEEFRCLKHLKHLIVDRSYRLIDWNADSSNFPVLERLYLVGLRDLKEIPSGIGDIPTLETMHMSYCSESSTISAVKIIEEQLSLGNQDLQLQLSFSAREKAEAEIWRARVEELGITSQNLQFVIEQR